MAFSPELQTWREYSYFQISAPAVYAANKEQRPAKVELLMHAFPFRSSTWQLEQPSERDMEERLAVATIAADIGIWDLDVVSQSLNWCHRCAKIFGAPLDTSRWYEDFLARLHPEDRKRVHRTIQAALDPGGTGIYDAEYRVIRDDGEIRWIAANGKTFFEQVNGTRTAIRFLGTLLDRTKQKQAHHALVESEKMAITGRLAVSIAHEIRNPLEAVSNLLYIIRDEPARDKRDEYLSLAESELARLNEIATNTLRFYKDPVGTSTVDAADLIRSVLIPFRSRISTLQVKVQTQVSADTFVEAPQGELRQVLVNLIGNALDAMPNGGRLIVRARASGNHTNTPCVRFSIADTGHGMAPEIAAKLFTAFYTTKGGSGTGIGLWLSQEILHKCSSRMHVKSTVGRGTVFSFCLPSAESHPFPLPSDLV